MTTKISEPLCGDERSKLNRVAAKNAVEIGLPYLLMTGDPYIARFLIRVNDEQEFRQLVADCLRKNPRGRPSQLGEHETVEESVTGCIKHLRECISKGNIENIKPLVSNIALLRDRTADFQLQFYQRVGEVFNQDPLVVEIYFNLMNAALHGLSYHRAADEKHIKI